MADGVAITAGSGTNIATDDCGAAGHTQIVKLAISTDGSATAIPADGTYGLAVDVARIAAGDNNIGNVDLASAIPAGTNLIGKVSASAETGSIYNGATALTPKWAIISCSSSGSNAIVSAVSQKKIRVLQCKFSSNGTVNAKFQSASTDLEGLAYEIASAGYVLPFSPIGWFETVAGEALNLNLSAAIAVGGVLAYIEV